MIFKGRISILRKKSNSGIISLDEIGTTEIIKFHPIYEHRDRVEVTFKNDNPQDELKSIQTTDEEEHIVYGKVEDFNVEKLSGKILCTYPKAIGGIYFDLSSSFFNTFETELDVNLYFNKHRFFFKVIKTTNESEASIIREELKKELLSWNYEFLIQKKRWNT